MNKTIRFGDLIFDESFLFAHRGDEELRFTRHERALLLLFTRSGRKLLRREQLLDAISGAGSDISDRNVDFLINRLRNKLGDRARDPAYIATQYGEGYLWIAAPSDNLPPDTLLVIGPVYGLAREPRAQSFLDGLREALDSQTTPDRPVVLAPDWRPGSDGNPEVRFFVEISLHADRTGLHCAAVLRDLPGRRILHTQRLVLASGDDTELGQQIETYASELKTSIWARLTGAGETVATPTDEPLELRVHNAALLLARSDESWMEGGAQIAQDRAADPSNPRHQLMWGMHLLARLTLGGIDSSDRTLDDIETEIEALVFDALPHIGSDPILMLAAARLLIFINCGHLDLAGELAEQAFAQSVAFASAFAILGQVRMCQGEIEEAIALYDRGIELSEPSSEFHIYLLVLKCSAHLAINDRAALERTTTTLYTAKPITRIQIGLLVAAPDIAQLAPDLTELLNRLDVARARALITYLHYITARHFRQETHRTNILRGPIALLTNRFGPAIVDDDIWHSAPSLIPGT